MLKNRLLLCIIVSVGILHAAPLHGQISANRRHENRPHRKKNHRVSDSVWKKDFIITDTSAALIINRIEDINSTLNDINDVIENGYDTAEITESLPEYERNLKIIKYTISTLSGSMNLNNLSLIRNRLDDMSEDLKDWQSSLLAYYTELVGMNTQIRTMSLDSTVRELPEDSALRFLYLRQVSELKKKWHSTDTTTKRDLLKIDILQTNVSNQYIQVTELQKQVKELVKSYNRKAFGKEYPYIWEARISAGKSQSVSAILKKTSSVSAKSLEYYFASGWQRRIMGIGFMLLFFGWSFINRRKIKRNNPDALLKLKFIASLPLSASLIILLTIAPFLDMHPAAAYLQFLEVLQIIVLTFILSRLWSKAHFIYWSVFVLFFAFYAIWNQLDSVSYWARILSFVVEVFSITIGISFLRSLKHDPSNLPGYFKQIIRIYILLNILSALCNVFGRVTLSVVLGAAAISNFIQAIGLIIFILVFLEAIYLQFEVDKKSQRFTAYLNYQNVELRLRNILTIIAGILWFINLTQNLNVYDSAYDGIAEILSAPRTVGSTSFTLGSIVIFFFIIGIANLLQKYIGYFFGDTGDESVPDKKTRFGTSILLIRLLVLSGGFFLGILASGIPLDRVTIIIGALGVGIGLGLQNIVNNLVSGVILAIERPIQVGDLIEISGNTGRVKEIGIRSSRIITAEGAEIIIPNGDMLSQKLTNWTLSNDHLRVEMIIKSQNASDADKIKKIIFELMASSADIMTKPEPQVLIRSATQAGGEMQILFWVFEINKWIQLKSDMLQKIYEACSSQGINLI